MDILPGIAQLQDTHIRPAMDEHVLPDPCWSSPLSFKFSKSFYVLGDFPGMISSDRQQVRWRFARSIERTSRRRLILEFCLIVNVAVGSASIDS